jgi:hypothetical protein
MTSSLEPLAAAWVQKPAQTMAGQLLDLVAGPLRSHLDNAANGIPVSPRLFTRP